MSTMLVRNAAVLATMDAGRREIPGGGMFIRDGWIEQVDASERLPAQADEIVDLADHVVLPGFVNAHHHLFQAFDRACPGCQSVGMTGWLKGLYPRWARLTPKDIVLATEIGLGELARSGCTTVADHQYIWPNGSVAEDQIEVARRIGVRFHLGRGFQNIGEGSGGFAPRSLLEDHDHVLADCMRVIDECHDPAPGSFTQVFVAPSSIRTVTPDLLRDAAALARDRRVGFHMHLGETRAEIDFARERFGRRPAEVVEELGCVGPNAWFAHGVHFDEEDIRSLARNRCGICHCPTSNMRLASGIAPVEIYRAAGIGVGLGVDGSASNDSSNMLNEVRQALLVSRIVSRQQGSLPEPRPTLEMATLGGAKLLGRTDIGSLQPGCAADFIAIDLNRLELLGAAEDPVAAIALCTLAHVDHAWVHGRPLVRDGTVVGIDAGALASRYRARMAGAANQW